MNATELMDRIAEYGADTKGIADRFGGNAELYKSCFQDLLEEPNLELLRQSLDSADYELAFEAAHAIKGLAGNLGVTDFFSAVCALVESLRAKRYGDIAADYARVCREYQRLSGLLSDAAPSLAEMDSAPDASAAEPEDSLAVPADGGVFPVPEARPKAKKRDTIIGLAVLALVLSIALVGFLFTAILSNYRINIMRESAEHLLEISEQLRLYTEERISNDWKTAASIGESIRYSGLDADDPAVFDLICRQRDIWNATDVILYTENGYSISADGHVDANDDASDILYNAMKQGQYLSIIDSQITYTIPVDTKASYRDSRIVAVSVVQSMKSFLDEMDFSSFGGEAVMYLTEQNGVVLSMLSNERAISAYNFGAILQKRKITMLAEGVDETELLTVAEPTVFILSDGEARDYAVSMPIDTSTTPLRLFYLAPTDAVNRTMNSFSRQLSALCLLSILAVCAFAFAAFMGIYRNRKRKFDKAMLVRERMFDLLIRNTQTAFGLFTVNRDEPDYFSSNAERVIGMPYCALVRDGDGYSIRGGEGSSSDAILQINERMRDWDGKSEFRSGYIQNASSAIPKYFSLQLYPTDGEAESFVCIMQDVTMTFERESATRNALSMAERANEAKSRFLSNMSHDIRTPMNAIMNMTDFAIESADQPKKLGQYLQTIRESSVHLLHLINDVLDVSRIESGQTTVESAPFDLRAEILRQAAMIRPLADARSQIFITSFERLQTDSVLGDQLKLSQILINLLSNAVKFTPEKGAIRFSAEELPSLREDIASVRFTIEDNGIGISPENLPYIFEPFNRANDKLVSRIEGTGLGLSICHSYVTAMGGTIRCESEEGEGSVFTVELFFQKASAPREKEEDVPVPQGMPFLGRHCLLAEDNATNQLIARTILERLGFLIDVVSDGGECVSAFLSSTPGTYDVVYMDIQMPVLDGYHAAIAIRESAHPQAMTIPIVAMTANVFAEDIEKARISGMDGHLGKPIVSSKLVEETMLAIRKRKEVTA